MAETIHRTRLSDGRCVHYRRKSEFEALEREMFRDNSYLQNGIELKDGDWIFDIGANSGMFLLLAASRIRDGRVFAFELIPDTFEALARNCGEISRLQPRAFNIGLADRTGSAEFTYFYRSSVVSSMQPDDSPEFRAFGRTMVADHILEMRVSRSGAPAVRPRRVSVDRHRHPRQTLIPLLEPIP